ncbi:hypothetical protein T4A_188, partial [Trichinella pseudospiralis]
MNYDDQIKSVILHSTDMTIEYSSCSFANMPYVNPVYQRCQTACLLTSEPCNLLLPIIIIADRQIIPLRKAVLPA